MDSQPLPLPPPNAIIGLPISDTNPPVWPRRTAKACASCRRDKIRCDGARPCSGCVKKGFSPDQCIDGCEHCRRARVRCEGGKPCTRCCQMQMECVEEAVMNSSRNDASSVTAARSARMNASDRAKLACQNCRRDNKKCEDQRPCSRCIARSEECIHVGRGPKLVKLRCEACRRENKRCEDIRPCKHCIESGKECVNVARKGRGHGTRVKAACTNCRRDKIRCDGVRPCSTCARKGYECVDRACKSCTQKGNETECTHRRNQVVGDSDVGDDANAHHASSSTLAQLPLPPMGYSLGPVTHYYHPPPPPGGPSEPPPMMRQVMYSTNNGPATHYFPVIDPNIDAPPPTSSVPSGHSGPSTNVASH